MTLSDTYTTTDILTGVLVIVTMFYAWATFHILKANKGVVEIMQSQLEQVSRPYIQASMFVRTGTPLLYLRIQNTGKSAAQNLKLEIDKDYFQFGEKRDDKNIRLKSAFQRPISCFPPDSVIEFALGMGHQIFSATADDAVSPKLFSVTATYSFSGKTVTEVTEIDLSPYLETDIPRNVVYDGLSEIKEAIKQLAKAVEKSEI